MNAIAADPSPDKSFLGTQGAGLTRSLQNQTSKAVRNQKNKVCFDLETGKSQFDNLLNKT